MQAVATGRNEVLVADAVNLPYRTGYGDVAISIAVLHHLSSESRREKAVEELIRIVKKVSLESISETEESVSAEQSLYLPKESEDERSTDIMYPSCKSEDERSDEIKQPVTDLFRQIQLKRVVYVSKNILCHGTYLIIELKLASNVEGAVIVDRFYDKSNWCIILEKTSS
ncbi:hypothetical protein SASPL_141466 [Salvia splendens]|uniref:Methyltransferase type 11 domain-containing protein n=1 Tax=Salvia splendens TaxID=180675 RepID=A0A8X8WTP9_SALSN|nr:hypothetical protein SASPL_141466 [Salvia splendens]